MPASPTLFAEPVEIPKPDTVADALIENGLVPNSFILDLNGCLTVRGKLELSYPWDLPSRLFGFPIEVSRQAADGSRTMSLRHPLLADHPFVKYVVEATGLTIESESRPDNHGSWWHAVDLISRGMWRELLDTARFTTPGDIASAVSYGLDYSPYEGKKRNGHISTTDARKVMAAIEAPEPTDAVAIVEQHFCRPSGMRAEKGPERWPINAASHDPYAKAWGHILAIEAGWFAHDRAGFLGWTQAGRDRFPPLPRVEREIKPYVPPAPIQPKLTDQIAPRRVCKAEKQMDLF